MESKLNKSIPKTRWIRVIPICMLAYIIAFVDRSVVSFAITGGMPKELGMTASVSGMMAGVFAIGNLFLQVPGGALAAKGKAKKFISITIVFWAISTFLLGFVTNSWQAVVLRFALGFAEGGLYPAVMTVISNWFPNEERGRAVGLFLTSNAISQIALGPIAGFIVAAYSWRYLFFFSGILAVGLLFLWVPFFVERPEDAKWLSKEERDYIVNSIKAENETLGINSTSKPSFAQVMKDKNAWKLAISAFCTGMGVATFATWAPQMIKNITNTGIANVGLLSTIPNICAMIGVMFFSFASDKTQKRRLLTSTPPVFYGIAIAGAMMVTGNTILSFAIFCFAAFLLQANQSSFWTLPSLTLKPEIAGASRGFINGIGNLSGFFGPYIMGFFMDLTGSMVNGLYCLLIFPVIGWIVVQTMPKHLNDKKNA